MKLEAKFGLQSYFIELPASQSLRPGSALRLRIQTPDGEKVVAVRILSQAQDRWTLEIDGKIEDVVISRNRDDLLIDWRNQTFPVRIQNPEAKTSYRSAHPDIPGIACLTAQMPGKVVAVLARAGDSVDAGQGLVIIEAMKMQNELRSPKSGTVIACKVQEGQTINAGDLLFEIR